MFPQQNVRPEIARVAEETVLNLKQLETRIEVLKNDLAALCTVIGHPEAARVAVTPASWLGVTAPHLTGQVGTLSVGSQGLLGQQNPYLSGIGGSNPMLSGIQGGISPLTQGISPFGISPLTQGISPLTQGFSPLTQGFSPYATGVPAFGSSLSPLSFGIDPRVAAFSQLQTPFSGFR
jgi:hypothetical protein